MNNPVMYEYKAMEIFAQFNVLGVPHCSDTTISILELFVKLSSNKHATNLLRSCSDSI